VFITGSSDGLGLMAARLLVADGHSVTLHARSQARADDTRAALTQADSVVIGDLSHLAGMRQVAEQANASGRFDAIIHNAGIGYRERRRVETQDGLAQVFAVNVLAPYLLTCLIERPDRLVYLSSGMHSGGDPDLDDPQWTRRRWNGAQAYSDSKLFDVVRRVVERDDARLGTDQDGRPRRAGRHVPGAGHAGVAGRQHGSRGHGQRRLLLPQAAEGNASRRAGRQGPGRTAQLLRRAGRPETPQLSGQRSGPSQSRISAQARTIPVPTAAPATTSVK
jgi:hypothetical protein